MDRVYLSIGSNLGDRAEHLRVAVDRLSELGRIVRVSSMYETRPVGNTDQPDFINAAVEFCTELAPEELLDKIKSIEQLAGRDLSAARWTARPLDIDILMYGMRSISTDRLVIPHPRLSEREFVLAPLCEIAAGALVPGSERTVAEIWVNWKSAHPVREARLVAARPNDCLSGAA